MIHLGSGPNKTPTGLGYIGPTITVPFLIFCLIKIWMNSFHGTPLFQNPSNSFALSLSSFLMLTSTNDFLHYWALNIPISLSLSLGFCWYNQSISSHSLQQMDRRFNGPTTPSTSTDAAAAASAAKSTPLPPQPNYNSRAVKVLFIFGLTLYIHI